jgi:hypothetical protein
MTNFVPSIFSKDEYLKKSWDNRHKVTMFFINVGPLWQYNYSMINNKFSDRIELVIVAFVILGLMISRYNKVT